MDGLGLVGDALVSPLDDKNRRGGLRQAYYRKLDLPGSIVRPKDAAGSPLLASVSSPAPSSVGSPVPDTASIVLPCVKHVASVVASLQSLRCGGCEAARLLSAPVVDLEALGKLMSCYTFFFLSVMLYHELLF